MDDANIVVQQPDAATDGDDSNIADRPGLKIVDHVLLGKGLAGLVVLDVVVAKIRSSSARSAAISARSPSSNSFRIWCSSSFNAFAFHSIRRHGGQRPHGALLLVYK